MLASPAVAQQRSLGPSTGTVRIEQVQAGFIASGEAGGGTLRYRAAPTRSRLAGSASARSAPRARLRPSTVYGLHRVSDFAGPYVQLKEGWAVGGAGHGAAWLRNDKGVTLRLATRRQGLQLQLGADGVLIGFRQ